ncbi:MAG: ATP-grasp domain-containing protein, partial [Candidatus Paceibacterota bacterium]
AIIKPIGSGSSFGVAKAENFHELEAVLPRVLSEFGSALIEEFISGREATCGVVENFRGQKLYSLLPIEIIKPTGNDIFDYETKYGGEAKEICPGNFSPSEKTESQRLAKEAHEALGLRHYSRSDFIVNPKRGIYTLETNTLPGLTSESLFPKALEAVGADLPSFLDHLVKQALLTN